MIHGFDWTHTPNKEDLERDEQAPETYRYWKKFRYIRTAKRFGIIVHTEVITVYVRTERIFHTLLRWWNGSSTSSAPLNPGLTWHYAPAPDSIY
jgi:hypothetical protein